MVHVEKSRLTPETSEVGVGYHWHDHANVVTNHRAPARLGEGNDVIQINDNCFDRRILVLIDKTTRPVRETHRKGLITENIKPITIEDVLR